MCFTSLTPVVHKSPCPVHTLEKVDIGNKKLSLVFLFEQPHSHFVFSYHILNLRSVWAKLSDG